MAITDALRGGGVKGPNVPGEVRDKMSRGREQMLKDASLRRLCHKFWANEQYWYVGNKGLLLNQDTVTRAGGGKPPDRIRNNYNFIHSIVQKKVSSSTQRVPGYEVMPSTGDRMDDEAATQAAQIAIFGYDKWRLRRLTKKVITNALVQREGFAMPYFDQNVGPFTEQINLETGEAEHVGQGEIKVLSLSRSEVYWEAGQDFDDSRWHCTERATPIAEVEEIPGYFGGKLTADASTSDVPTDKPRSDMVILTDYLERPCPKYPNGRRLRFANDKQVCPKEDYPAVGPSGEILDEPVLHRLSYTVDPDGDDRGLVELLIDLQRTINDCWNKRLEWKNRALNPQMTAPKGAFKDGFQRNDIPGYTYFYNRTGADKPEWETVPQIPGDFRMMIEDAILMMRLLAADVDVQAAPDVAAKSMQAAIEAAQQAWADFLGDLAEFHSRLMRHCLALVQQYYSDERTIQVEGEHGYTTLENFKGQDLRSQCNVRVLPGSLESRSRESVRADVQFMAEAYPGAVTPEAALAAINGGWGANMLRSYQGHVSQAWRLVQRAKGGLPALEQMGSRFDKDVPATDEHGMPVLDPMTGMQVIGDDIPAWMPRKQANVDIWKEVFSNYMTTPSFEQLTPDIQHVFDLVWEGLEKIQKDRAMAEMMQRDMMAAGQGLDNAAAPQSPPPLPDRSTVTPR